jgi:hypothetical protein
MDKNLISDKRLLDLCSFAEKSGLQYIYHYAVNDYYKQLIEIGSRLKSNKENDVCQIYNKKDIEFAKDQITAMTKLIFDNKYIEHVGYSIETSENNKAYLTLMYSYKPPDPGEINLFLRSAKVFIEESGLKYDKSIPYLSENICSYATEIRTLNKKRIFMNPLNTKIFGFYQERDIFDTYCDWIILFAARHTNKKSMYLNAKAIGGGHFLMTLLAK